MSDAALYDELLSGAAASLPLPDRAVWRLTGQDRVRYLNGQVTNDVAKLVPGHALHAAVLTGKGRMEGECFLAATEEALWIDAPLSLRESLRARLEKFLIADDVMIDDVTEEGRLSHWFGAEKPEGPLVSRNARFGLPGWDVWAAQAVLREPVVPAELADRIRIAHGLGVWGRELDAQTLPQEALLDRAGRGLSYEKGCYVGQETVARIHSIGHVNRLMVFLRQTAGPAEPPAEMSPLFLGEKEIGKMTSAAPGMALGYVGRNFAEEPGELRAADRVYRIVPPRSLPG